MIHNLNSFCASNANCLCLISSGVHNLEDATTEGCRSPLAACLTSHAVFLLGNGTHENLCLEPSIDRIRDGLIFILIASSLPHSNRRKDNMQSPARVEFQT